LSVGYIIRKPKFSELMNVLYYIISGKAQCHV
jgi:hypothetical protein